MFGLRGFPYAFMIMKSWYSIICHALKGNIFCIYSFSTDTVNTLTCLEQNLAFLFLLHYMDTFFLFHQNHHQVCE